MEPRLQLAKASLRIVSPSRSVSVIPVFPLMTRLVCTCHVAFRHSHHPSFAQSFTATVLKPDHSHFIPPSSLKTRTGSSAVLNDFYFQSFTARSELLMVLFLGPSVCVFLFVYEISREPLNGFAPNSHGRRVWSLARRSLKVKVKVICQDHQGQKRHAVCACVRFVFGKTSLASSFRYFSLRSVR